MPQPPKPPTRRPPRLTVQPLALNRLSLASVAQVRQRLEAGRLVLYSLLAGLSMGLLGCGLRWLLNYTQAWGSLLTGYSPPATAGEGGLLMAFGQSAPYALLGLPIAAALSAWLSRPERRPERNDAEPSPSEPPKDELLPPPEDPLAQEVREYHARRPGSALRGVQQWAGQLLAYSAGLHVGRDSVYMALGGLNTTLLRRISPLSRAEERSLTLASRAAALGMVLHAPIAAAVLLTEVLYQRFEFEADVLLPALLTSVSAYAVYELVYGAQPLFDLGAMQVPGAAQLPLYALLALVCALVAWANVLVAPFVTQLVTQRATPRLAARVSPRLLRGYSILGAALFGLISALIALYSTPAVLGGGAGWLQLALSGFLGTDALGYAAWKWLLLGLGVRLGFGGGVLPSASTGALLGVGLNALAGQYLSSTPLDPSVCALVAASAYLSVTLNAPVAATLLAMSWGGEALLPTTLIAAGLGHAISGQRSFIAAQKRDRLAAEIPLIRPNTTILSAPPLEGEGTLYRVAAPPLWLGQRLGRLPLPAGVRLVGLERGQEIMLPTAALRLQASDVLDIVAGEAAFAELKNSLNLH